MVMTSSVLVTATLGGCGDDDATGAASTSEVAETTVPETVAPVVVVQEHPAKSTTTNASSASTLAAVTTTSPGTTDEEAVEAGVLAQVGVAERATYEVLRNPEAPELVALGPLQAATAPGSVAQDRLMGFVRAHRAVGNMTVANEEIPFTVTVEGDVVVVNSETVLVIVCVVNSETIVSVAQGGERTIVDDRLVASRVRETFVLSDDSWQLSDFEILDQFAGETTCPTE